MGVFVTECVAKKNWPKIQHSDSSNVEAIQYTMLKFVPSYYKNTVMGSKSRRILGAYPTISPPNIWLIITRVEMPPDFLPSSGYTACACWWKDTRSLLETSTIPQSQTEDRWIHSEPLPLQFECEPSPLFPAMPPVSSAFLLGLPVFILADLALFDDSLRRLPSFLLKLT